ncbi:MAG: crossover junction endodeoxyribonuclease RuvC, partial [Clostridia bacterium]|nr:crossover junction endodeoxyribonuclease RuvC [Clostridia bacterium]
MIILGIDPGLATVGYGVISSRSGISKSIDYGAVITKAGLLLERRLELIYDHIGDLIEKHKPDAMAIE